MYTLCAFPKRVKIGKIIDLFCEHGIILVRTNKSNSIS